MSDYIDRYKAIAGAITAIADGASLYATLKAIPSADVEPVVRCKNCKHNYSKKHNKRYNHEDILCDYWETDGLNDDDFCSYGARMDGEEK